MVSGVFAQQVVVPEHVMIRILQGESVVLNLDSEWYVGLDEVGTRMWEVLVECQNVEVATQRLLGEYEVEEAQLRADVETFIGELLQRDLIELKGSNPA